MIILLSAACSFIGTVALQPNIPRSSASHARRAGTADGILGDYTASTGTTRADAAADSSCVSRRDCSGRGECGSDGMCVCETGFEGATCDVWRATRSSTDDRLPWLRDVLWENCTHGRHARGGNNSAVMQLCKMHNRSMCEAAGAPTVPPPNFTQADCYQKPESSATPSQRTGTVECAAALTTACDADKLKGLNDCVECVAKHKHNLEARNCSSIDMEGFCASAGPNLGHPVCPDFKGIPTVLHGVKGSFCARPCVTKQSASCEDCPCPPTGPCPCQIKNKNGTCMFCSGECKAEGHLPAIIDPCSYNSSMVCPCAAPPDVNGKPILAKPQCIATDCNAKPTSECWGTNCKKRLDRRRPLCALTCDPDAVPEAGQSNCQTGATCERVPGATFNPPGVCTFPKDSSIPEYLPGDSTNKSIAKLPQLPGWAWGDYHGAPAGAQCPQIREYVCVRNGSEATGGGQAYCVDAGATAAAGLFPFFNIGCMGCGRAHPPANWTPPLPGDPRCHPHPPVPSPPMPPPPPLATTPCIRFGHTIPVGHHVDVEIVQDEDPSVTHTWTDYQFGAFSDWVNVFREGKGTVTIWENVGGARGKQVYQLKGIPLTPGPLVVTLKVASSLASQPEKYWPPTLPDSIETIAASYVQSEKSSKVRLFNLSPDTQIAGMTCSANGTAQLAKNVRYSLGSPWYEVPTAASTFSVQDDLTGATVTTRLEEPPAAPLGFTNMFIGLQKGSGEVVAQLVPLADAPEGGVCKPGAH